MGEKTSDGARPLIDWVLKQFPDTPKKRAKQWIMSGRVRVDGGIRRRPHERLPDPGTRLRLSGQDAAAVYDGKLNIHRLLALRYADTSLAVVEKSAGLLSVPAPGRRQISALTLLRDFLAAAAPKRGPARDIPPQLCARLPLPVHRLDQYSSGLLCVAMNANDREALIKMFSSHDVTREYIAFIDGRLPAARGSWRDWLMLDETGRVQSVVTKHEAKAARARGMEAVTDWESIEVFELAARGGSPGAPDRVISKIRCSLVTGARHQIRVQAAHAGVPIIGDRRYHPLYGESSDTNTEKPPIGFPRQALHASKLGFKHPQSAGREMIWTSDLPDDMRQLENQLRASRSQRTSP